MSARVLVTGGAGFIGSNLVDGLLSRGRDVTVFDDLSTGRIENLTPALNGGARLHRGSVTDAAAVARAFEVARPDSETSVLEVAGALGLEVRFAPERPGEVRRSCLAPASAAQALGWRSRTTFRDGLWLTVAHVLADAGTTHQDRRARVAP